MAQINLTLLGIFLSLSSSLAPVEPRALATRPRQNPQTMAYIESSCQGTRYPDLCIRCLAKFANSPMETPRELAHVALSVSLYRALRTRGYLLNVAKELKELRNKHEYLTVQDCLTQIDDGVDQLSQAIKELRRMKRNATIDDDLFWHISNVETWVSTALTDASSCVDSLPGQRMSKLKATIKVKALNVAEVTSNALALFHGYAAKYREAAARAATKKP